MSDIKRKLLSRKFWLAAVSLVTLLLAAFGVPDSVAAQVASIIMAGAAVVAYILGEGFIDAASAGGAAANGTTAGADVADAQSPAQENAAKH